MRNRSPHSPRRDRRYKLEEVCALEARGWIVVDVDSVVQTADMRADVTRAVGAAGVPMSSIPSKA